jgi:hypothetical protein
MFILILLRHFYWIHLVIKWLNLIQILKPRGYKSETLIYINIK